MFFESPFSKMDPSGQIGLTIGLIFIDILLLKLALIITNAQEKRNIKWVVGSFGIQFGIVFFISSPLILYGMIGAFQEGGEWRIIPLVIIFSVFIDLNVVNILHKIGLKRSLVVMIFVVVPIVLAMLLLGFFLGDTFHLG
ncbi:MAG: hypothetical protein ACFFDH_13675 [Promethearchaeota archaeon]